MNANANQAAIGAMVGVLVCIGVVLLLFLGIYIFFLLTLSRTQSEVSERNREMAPGLVWLTLIPLFSAIWLLFMVPKLSNSLRREYEDRGWPTGDEGFARTSGMIWAWGGIASLILGLIQNGMQFGGLEQESLIVGLLALPVNLAVLISWIMYWVQMAGYGKTLRSERRGYRDHEEADYDDDYRPRRSRDTDNDDADDYDQRGR